MNKESLIAVLIAHAPQELADTIPSSAVLILMVMDGDGVSLVITKRAEGIAYAGDFCFPGGMKEAQDQDFLATAQRELEEELGINAQSYQIIGVLDDFLDRYQQRVRPFVGIIEKSVFNQQLKILAAEIAEIHFFPLLELPLFQQSEELERLTRRHPSYFFARENVRIWGLTASIMVHLGNIVYGLGRPVGKQKI